GPRSLSFIQRRACNVAYVHTFPTRRSSDLVETQLTDHRTEDQHPHDREGDEAYDRDEVRDAHFEAFAGSSDERGGPRHGGDDRTTDGEKSQAEVRHRVVVCCFHRFSGLHAYSKQKEEEADDPNKIPIHEFYYLPRQRSGAEDSLSKRSGRKCCSQAPDLTHLEKPLTKGSDNLFADADAVDVFHVTVFAWPVGS